MDDAERRAAVQPTAMRVLHDHRGTARLASFLRAGLTPRQVAAMHRSRTIERPRSGWHADPRLPWQALCAIRVGGVLACVSALESYGLPVPPESYRRVHVLVPGNAPRRRHSRNSSWCVVPGQDAGVELHWSSLDGQQAGWRTPLVDALALAAHCSPEEWWIAALDAALHAAPGGAPLLSSVDLVDLAARLPGRLRRRILRAEPRAESCIETLLRLGMLACGLGPVLPRCSPDGRHRVDFLLPGKVLVEADGAAFHDTTTDARRDGLLRGPGCVVLRFSYERIVHDLDAVLDEIEAAVRRAARFVP